MLSLHAEEVECFKSLTQIKIVRISGTYFRKPPAMHIVINQTLQRGGCISTIKSNIAKLICMYITDRFWFRVAKISDAATNAAILEQVPTEVGVFGGKF